MVRPMSTATPLLFRAKLSDSIIKEYDIAAARRGITAEEVMSETLTRFADFESAKPLILSDAQRRSIEAALGKNLNTADDLVRAVIRTVSVAIDGTELQLSQYLLDRLRTRCIGVDFDVFVKRIIREQLEAYAGLR